MNRGALTLAVCVAAAAALSAQRPGAPAVAIGQSSTATLEGTLIGAGREGGLANVRLALTVGATVAYEATTNDQGEFQFRDITPGTYRVEIQRAKYTIGLGQVRLLAGQSLTRIYRKGVVVAGRVLDETGKALAEAPVCLFRIVREGGIERFRRATSVLTNLVGEFVLGRDVIVDSDYYVLAAVPTGCDQSTSPAPGNAIAARYGPTYYPGTSSPLEAARTALRPEEDTEVTLTLRPATVTRLQGQVTNYVNTSVVRDLIRLEPLTNEPLAIARTADVQRNGSFVFPGLLPGQYRLMLPPRKGPDPTVWVDEIVTIRGERVASVSFVAQPTRTIGGTMSFAGRPTPLYGTEVFLVVNAEPVGAGQSVAWSIGGNFGRVSINGHFGITGLVPGRYRLSVSGSDAFGWRPKFASVPTTERRLTELDALDVPFTVEPDQDVLGVHIEMSFSMPTVAGRIDGPDGRPAPGVSVLVFATDSRYLIPGSRRMAQTRTDPAGAFHITTLPEGDYLAVAVPDPPRQSLGPWLESLRPRAVPFRLDDGEVQELALRLPSATPLPLQLSKLLGGRLAPFDVAQGRPANGQPGRDRLSSQRP